MTPPAALMPDRVLLKEDPPREISIDEFLKTPIESQVELLIAGRVVFFAGTVQLRTLDALRILMQARTARAASGGR